MADSALYRYTSDDYVDYSMLLPEEFADQFSYQLALGIEPFLPSFLSPRYATYSSLDRTVTLTAFLTRPYNVLGPPASVNIGTNQYFLVSQVGEQRGIIAQANIITVAGPQGQPGPAGNSADYHVVAGRITAADILQWNMPASELVAATGGSPGAVPVHLLLEYFPGAIPYVGGGTIILSTGSYVWAEADYDWLSNLSPGYQLLIPATGHFDETFFTDPLLLGSTGSPTFGDGEIGWSLAYRMVPVSH